MQEQRWADGRAVSPHDPLMPAVLALPMRFGGWIAAKLVLAVARRRARRAHGVDRRAALRGADAHVAVITVLAFSATAPLAMYGTQVYPELPAALVGRDRDRRAHGSTSKPRLVALTVARIVALPWLSVKYAPVAAALAFVAAVRWWRAGIATRCSWSGGVLAVAGVVVPRSRTRPGTAAGPRTRAATTS